MSLLSLPNEILTSILHLAGTSDCRTSCDRLLVCKRWYLLLRAMLLNHLEITASNIGRFPPTSKRAYRHHRQHTRHLSVQLVGYEDWECLNRRARKKNAKGETIVRPPVLPGWTADLNLAIISLGELMPSFQRLTHLTFRARNEVHIAPAAHRDYLWDVSIASLLARAPMYGLTVLDLDTSGSHFESPNGSGEAEGIHVCPLLKRHFSTLRKLRLRMREICPEVVEICLDAQASPLRLEQLIINLSLQEERDGTVHVTHARRCGGQFHPFLRPAAAGLLEDMVDAVREARKGMPELKMARIVSHRDSDLETMAVDCLTGQRLLLSDGAEWDDEGMAYNSDDDRFLSPGTDSDQV
ncbi:MAG: hypothetical protein M1817_006836 [Caeruleum heppii]|nr:MAG: hypothetical protein M1817_006836 [Caeruleum heppii]